MENVLEFLENAFSVFIFVLAISLLLIYRGEFEMLLSAVNQTVGNTNVIYEVGEEQPVKDTISYSELCSQLASPLSYDIEVVGGSEDITFIAETYNYLLFDFNTLPRAENYKRTYIYENDKIKMVRYQVVN